MNLKKGKICSSSFFFWVLVCISFNSNSILLAQSFPLTFIHPNQQDSTIYFFNLSDSALNGLDSIDEIDSSFYSHLDIKGYNFDIDTSLGLGTCTNLKLEAKPLPDSSNLDIYFFFRVIIDTPYPIPPLLGPAFGILSWDSSIINDFDTIGEFELAVVYMTCSNCYLNDVDNYLVTFYASNVLGIWTNPLSNSIIYEVFAPRICDPSFTLRIDFEYRKIISSLSDKILKPDGRIYYSPQKTLVYEKKSFVAETLSIYDLRGRMILHETLAAPQKYALTSRSAQTIGILRIESKNGVYSRKVFY
jgi:hypothetical protein